MEPLHSDTSRRNKNLSQNATNNIKHNIYEHMFSTASNFQHTTKHNHEHKHPRIQNARTISPNHPFTIHVCPNPSIRPIFRPVYPKIHRDSNRNSTPSKNRNWTSSLSYINVNSRFHRNTPKIRSNRTQHGR
ncbi:hypothetical protein RYX36_013801 [Vicia faba]